MNNDTAIQARAASKAAFAKRFILPILLLAASQAATAGDIEPFGMPSARLAGMGGTHAALADDFSTLFSNPAGLADVKSEFSFAELTAEVSGPIMDIIDLASQSSNGEDLDISGLVGANGLRAGLDLGGPLSLGWVGKGFGFGIFNRSVVTADAVGSTITAKAREDILLTGGYAFRLPIGDAQRLDIGFLAKGYLRGETEAEGSVLTVQDVFNGDNLMNEPFTLTAGVGLDVGLRYGLGSAFSAALVCHDLISPALVSEYAGLEPFQNDAEATSESVEYVDRRLDVGVMYTPKLPFVSRSVSNLKLLADYRDLLDLLEPLPRNPVLNASFGAELTVFRLFSLRAGIADALPNAGLGIDLLLFRLDFAVRGTELGLDPGTRPVYNMDFGILFRY